jgi:hypothetical protein
MAKPYARARESWYKIIGGHMKNKKFLMTAEMSTVLRTKSIVEAAASGSIAAKNAIKYDGYKDEDGPFFCGTIKGGTFIIASKHLGPQIIIEDK